MQFHVLYRAGSHHCYSTTTGIDRVEVGCSHRIPRDAIDHSTALASRSGSDDLAAVQAAARSRDDRTQSEAPDENGLASGVPAAGAVPPALAAPDFGF